MHPLIRIISLLVVIVALAQPDWLRITILVLVCLVGIMFFFRDGLAHIFTMARRLKWFFLSIIIVYAWFTPGEPVTSSAWLSERYLPTVTGLEEGALRVVALLLMISFVTFLIHKTAREELVSAIVSLCIPLKWFGVSVERFALRISLTLEKVSAYTIAIKGHVQSSSGQRGIVNRAANILTTAIQNVESGVDHDKVDYISLSMATSPAWWQWFMPAGFIIILFYPV